MQPREASLRSRCVEEIPDQETDPGRAQADLVEEKPRGPTQCQLWGLLQSPKSRQRHAGRES